MNGLIDSITIVAPIFNTNPQSPFSNLFRNETLKFTIYMCDPTFNCEEKVVAKVELIINKCIKVFYDHFWDKKFKKQTKIAIHMDL